jgi:nitroreductase
MSSDSKTVSGDSEHTQNRSGRRTGRRAFVRDLSVLSLAALAAPTLLEAASPEVTPAASPAAAGPAAMSVWDALKSRKSAAGFQSQPVPQDLLLNLLWAAFGINRPDSGKRTAPSAMNAQEIDVYALLADGAYVYDPKGNALSPVLAQDLRSKAGQGAMRGAPVHLLYVADYARLGRASQSQRELFSAAHTGFIGQNVYLFCAAEGLGARFYAGFDRAALTSALKLRDDQAIVFAQAVGYARE